MARRLTRTINPGKRILASSALVAIAAVGVMNPSRGHAQEAAPPTPAFEVASVKPASAAVGGILRMGEGPGTINYVNLNLRDILARAYEVKPYQIQGPSWIDSERYNINAKLPEGVSEQRIPAMLQALLAERFRMTVHRETKDLLVYALMVGKDGPNLKKSAENAAPTLRASGDAGGAPTLQITGMALGNVVNILSNTLDRPVVDMTGIQGKYDFSLELDARDPTEAGASQSPENAPTGSIFASFQRLGLRLEPRKVPFECIVVDKAEKLPVEN